MLIHIESRQSDGAPRACPRFQRAVLGRRRVAAIIALVLLGMPLSAWAETQPVDLRPQWREGQTSRYEISSERVQHHSMTAGQQQREQRSTMQTSGEVTWHVEHVASDGSAQCRMTFDWLRMTMRDDQQEQVNDSRQGSGDTPPLHAMLRAMTGVAIGVEVAADGTIQAVSNTAAIRRALEHEELAPSDVDLIENASKLATLINAPAAAEPGDQWRVEHQWRHELGSQYETIDWRLEGIEHIADIPIATVVGQGAVEVEMDEAQMPEGAPPIDMTMRDGNIQAQVLFDLQRGEVVGRNSVEQTRIEMTIRIPEQTVHQQIEQTVQSQVLRIEEEDGQ